MQHRDPTEFRKRFALYKEGKNPYQNGLPKYELGKNSFSDEEAMDYILQLENPNRIGYSNGIWRPPADSTKYDVHLIGGGLDMREEHNPIVYNFLKGKGRLNNPYLTEAEEKLLRMQTWRGKRALMDKFVAAHGDLISQLGYNTAAGMLWHGHPFKKMNQADSVIGKALLNALATGDKDLTGVFDAYYGYGDNAKRFASRINANTKYRKNYKPAIQPRVVKDSELVKLMKQQELFQPWSNYHQPDYSLNNPAPSSVSSWNNAQGPSYTASELAARRAYENIRGMLPLLLPLLEDDQWEPEFQLPKLKNGKLPRYGGGKDGYRYVKNDETGGWDRITDDDEANTMSNVVVTPYGVRNKFYYESNPNYIAPRLKGEVVKQDNNLWTRQQVEKANNTRTWRSDVADALHSIGEGAMMAANFVPFEGELAQGANWLYNTAKSYIRHPFYKTVYHGSPYPFDVNNAWTATYHDLGLHVGSKETATEMAGKDGVIYKLRIPKENTETIDIGANGSKQLYNSYFMPARSRQYPNDFYDTTPGDDLRIKLLLDAGAEPYIDGNRLYTENAVMIPLRRTAYPDIPEKYMRDVHEITRQTLMNEAPLSRFRVHDPILLKKLNQLANDILSNSGYKVIKYHNANPYEGGGTAYMITDPSVIDVMEDLPEFKRLILPSGIDASYVYSLYKDGKSPIHIKPLNRGKLTRLKKRTGKSESELYNDGNPAHKKMVVFARNARKWKH